MARIKLSEWKAKTLLAKELGIPYLGISATSADYEEKISSLDAAKQYVAKVDQGVKKRGKQGLVLLNKNVSDLPEAIRQLQEKGYSQFIIEPVVFHESIDERYLAIERVREGLRISYSEKGGMDIEDNQESVKQTIIPYSSSERNESRSLKQDSSRQARTINYSALGLPPEIMEKLLSAFDKYYFSFLELNPFVTLDSSFVMLDAACEVDTAGEFFVKGAWTREDGVNFSKRTKTAEEIAVEKLAEKSQASFKLEVLNADGSVFLLLSGGGASIVVADEVYQQGKGPELANYGEYSGNPSEEETYIYTKNLVSLLLKSKAPKKVLVIAGGVANFTDVRVTFRGIVKAFHEENIKLRLQGIKVFVRRGGPHQTEGLLMMSTFLEKEGLLGEVFGPEMILTNIVTPALKFLNE